MLCYNLAMLRKILFTLALTVLSFMGLSLSSVSYAADQPIIGVIDWRGAIFSTNEAKKENAAIQKKLKKDQQKLKSLETRIKKNRSKLEKSQEVLSDEQKEKLVAELQKDALEYQTLGQKVQKEFQEKEQEFIKKQTVAVQKIVEEIAEERNLHAIMRVDAVIYGRLTVDITQDVVDALNGKKRKKRG